VRLNKWRFPLPRQGQQTEAGHGYEKADIQGRCRKGGAS
jgi:hypothetical protein